MRIVAALILPLLACVATPAMAQEIAYQEEVIIEEVVVDGQGDARGQRFVEARDTAGAEAFPQQLAAFGPFRVLDETTAALVGVTDARSPAAFAAMLRAHPGLATIEMIDCPGTEDDHANLRLGRMIRAAGLVTYVPPGGSVRSGAVELFLAGARRVAAPQAEFAVHAWMDDTGHEATDYALSAPENAKYIDYYRAMGLSDEAARGFYAMTNSVRHADALWLHADDMARWVALDRG